MLDFITENFTKITSKCLDRYAKECNTSKKNVQLIFKLGTDDEPEYLIYKEYKPYKVLTFLEVLGVKLDFKGYSLFVPKFIRGALNRFCDEHSIEKSKVKVVLFFNPDSKMNMWLYNNSECIKSVELIELFDTTDILNEQ